MHVCCEWVGSEGFEMGGFTHSRFKQGVERDPAFNFESCRICAQLV